MYVVVYALVILLYLINTFTSTINLSYVVGIVALVAFIISAPRARGLYLITGTIFFIIGFSLFLFNDLPFYSFFLYFESMLTLLSLLLVLPFINSLIHVGHFDSQLNSLLNLRTKKLQQLYTRSSLVSHVLGIFINIATIPILVRSLHGTLKNYAEDMSKRFYSKSVLRGYALCLTWSPFEILLVIIVDASSVRYYEIFPVMFIIALLFLFLNWKLFDLTKESNYSIELPELSSSQVKRLKVKLIQLLLILLFFIFTVTATDHLLQKGFLLSVILVIIPFSITAALVIKKLKRYFIVTIPHWKERTNGLTNYFFMFLSAGFFVEMLTETPFFNYVQLLLLSFTEETFLFYIIIGAYFLCTALIGFHPLVSLVLFLILLEPMMSEIANIPFAMVLISCSVSTVMYSPFNLSVSIMSNEIKINPYKIMGWNIGYAVVYMVFCMVIAYALSFFIS